ncbi:hypothetical protein EUTSA_v10009400mg, partial [Eutrema salsugineum]
MKDCMDEITGALIDADFAEMVVDNIKGKIQETIPSASNDSDKGRLMYETFFNELCRNLDPRKSAIIEEKRKINIVMFVGLRGSGKSDTCAKYARHHLKMGYKPDLVCAETYSEDAFKSLQKTAGEYVPVYGSHKEDPAEIAKDGIASLVRWKRDFIVVDTSDSEPHEKWSSLFVEMRKLALAVKPNLVILVIDGSIGRVALNQARAFNKIFTNRGVVIVTNIKGNLKSVAALAVVAAVGCPLILAESGEFEPYEAKAFVRCLLENPWLSPANQHVDKTYKYTLRDMYEFYKDEFRLGTKPSQNRNVIERYLTIMESMMEEELDKPNEISNVQVLEIAARSNVDAKDVVKCMATYIMWGGLFGMRKESSIN